MYSAIPRYSAFEKKCIRLFARTNTNSEIRVRRRFYSVACKEKDSESVHLLGYDSYSDPHVKKPTIKTGDREGRSPTNQTKRIE
jgi:hypothetical protein